MTRTTMNAEAVHPGDEATSYLFDNWFDPIEAGLRERVRGFIETMLEAELEAVLARPRYGRQPAARSDETTGVAGHRHGSRTRTLTGTFGTTEITVPRARLDAGEDKTVEWKSKALRAYQRRTKAADALIASSYLAGTNTRRVRRALSPRCSEARSARTSSAAPGGRSRPTGMPGTPARWLTNRSCA